MTNPHSMDGVAIVEALARIEKLLSDQKWSALNSRGNADQPSPSEIAEALRNTQKLNPENL